MKHSQYEVIGRLISRKTGATPVEMVKATLSTCVHKRMSEMRNKGWVIRRVPVQGRTFGRYYGTPPLTWSVRGSR